MSKQQESKVTNFMLDVKSLIERGMTDKQIKDEMSGSPDSPPTILVGSIISTTRQTLSN